MRMNRTSTVLGATAVAAVAIAMTRPPGAVRGMTAEGAWVSKYCRRDPADVIFLGDSRVSAAFAPAIFAEVLAGKNVVNFGFAHTGYSGEYLSAAERRLRFGGGEKPTVVLGLSALAFSPASVRPEKSVWHRLRREWRFRLACEDLLQPLTYRFRRLATRALRDRWRGRAIHKYSVHHQDGWTENRSPGPFDEGDRAMYRDLFKGNRHDPNLVKGLVAQVRSWSHRGVRVYALRTPIPAWHAELERRESGLDVRSLRGPLEAAGARWLEVDGIGTQTLDGSHLVAESAAGLSRYLVEKIAEDVRRGS